MSAPFGLDFGAVLAMGRAQGADMPLLSWTLPVVEGHILDSIADEAPSE